LQELADAGIQPSVIAGTSIGALVGAAAAAGRLEALATWVVKLEWWDILRYVVEPGSGGLVDGDRLMRAYTEQVGDTPLELLPLTFGAVAADLNSGREIWLRQGSLRDAVRASIALPGLFAPVLRDGIWLVDGGLVDPVPVSLCRALGADLVIAVNLNQQYADRRLEARRRDGSRSEVLLQLGSRLQEMLAAGPSFLARLAPSAKPGQPTVPGILEVMAGALYVMQERITRSRMAGDPPELLVSPRLEHLGLFDFDRAEEAIVEGRAATRRVLPALLEIRPDIVTPTALVSDGAEGT
jgi:NTE family protein